MCTNFDDNRIKTTIIRGYLRGFALEKSLSDPLGSIELIFKLYIYVFFLKTLKCDLTLTTIGSNLRTLEKIKALAL